MANIDAVIKAAIKKAAIRRLEAECRILPTPATKRIPSTAERNAVFTPSQAGLLFCCHGKSWFDKCASCHRTAEIAALEYAAFCKRNKLRM